METLHIELDKRSYAIYIDRNLLARLPGLLDPAESWAVITDEEVYGLYGKSLLENWRSDKVHAIVLPGGEDAKNLQTVGKVAGQMLDLGLTRRSGILALGGGVIGDVAGFCASVYMRGIRYVQVPTTLLAQVDSSVGGKTGVNLAQGKNIVGSFYQPQGVFIDTQTLRTLPRRHLISGLAEVIKYGVIYDYEFLTYLDSRLTDILNLKDDVLKEVIRRCCEIKAEVVVADEKEQGLRKILNCGHTVGHALEAATDYREYTHGEAVLVGMYAETLMAEELGLIDQRYCTEILALIGKTGMEFSLDSILGEKLVDHMMKDKKNRDSRISFILPRGRGETAEVLLTRQEAWGLLRKFMG